MANCTKCGASLREGAKFCGACGAKIEIPRFCTECGEALEPGEKFCTQCGTPVEGAPVSKRRGRPPKNISVAPKASAVPAKTVIKKPDYPDVRGFYGNKRKIISVSSEALVWSDYYNIFRLERDWTLRTQRGEGYHSVIQTRDNILALTIDYEDDCCRMALVTLDKNLCELSRKELCEAPADDAVEKFDFYMTQFDLFVLQYTQTHDTKLGKDILTDVSLRQVNLSSDEIREWKWDRLECNGWTVGRGSIETVDGEKVYLDVDLYKDEDDGYAVLIFDPHTGSFSVLWQGDCLNRGGCPLFYDLEKHIMWTHPTKAEQESMRLSREAVVARKIAPNAPVLSNLPVWQELYTGHFTYFDGQHAYYAPDYYTFFGYIETGAKSEDWNQSGHGRTETAMVWPQAGKIVMDLMADYWYTIYPLVVAKPSYDELIPLRDQT